MTNVSQYFRHASEISSDTSMGKGPTQQAVVQSFLKNYDNVSYYFRHASEISSDTSMGKRPTQQAVVQSFLKNYDKTNKLISLFQTCIRDQQ